MRIGFGLLQEKYKVRQIEEVSFDKDNFTYEKYFKDQMFI